MTARLIDTFWTVSAVALLIDHKKKSIETGVQMLAIYTLFLKRVADVIISLDKLTTCNTILLVLFKICRQIIIHYWLEVEKTLKIHGPRCRKWAIHL